MIIDGIDVSECEFLKEGICYAYKDNEGYSDIECKYKENSNCYYKQLKRAEQENEKLKEEIKLAQELSDQSIEYFGNSREKFKQWLQSESEE